MSELSDTFEANAREAAAIVERCAHAPGAVRQAVERITANTSRIVIGGPEYVESEIGNHLFELPGVIRRPADEQLATADAGITGAFAGVAIDRVPLDPLIGTARVIDIPDSVQAIDGSSGTRS